MATIDFHPEAFDELEASAEWYLRRSEMAAKGFAVAVESALQKISDDPDRFPRVGHRCRACNLLSYPFQIVFRDDVERIFVVAVAHAKRRPGYWRGRMTGES
jgi:plasmid stabilization system protein ParE